MHARHTDPVDPIGALTASTHAGRSGPRRSIRLAAVLLLATAALALPVPAGSESPSRPADRERAETAARPVRTVTVAYASADARRMYSGVVKARIEADVGFRIDGKILERRVDVGDRVTAGQVLARLDEADVRLRLASAEADLRAAQSSLAQARADLARTTTLAGKGWVTTAESDRIRAAADEAEGRVSRDQRAVDLARNQLSYVNLVAPADGVVTAVSGEAGQVVAAGLAILRIARLDEKEALVALPEAAVRAARTATARVELWAEPGHLYAARLRELSPVADPATRTFAARYTIEGAGEDVALGMTATVTLTTPAAAPLARLPLAALFDDGSGPGVWIVAADGSVSRRPVDVAGIAGDDVLVRAGPREGETIVALGAHMIDPKLRVRAVDLRPADKSS